MIQRSIERFEVETAILKGEIIEEYPDDKYAPSCFIYGNSEEDRELHVHTSLPPKVVIITVYVPDPAEWIAGRIRR